MEPLLCEIFWNREHFCNFSLAAKLALETVESEYYNLLNIRLVCVTVWSQVDYTVSFLSF